MTGPVAVYWIDTTTSSGMTLSGMGARDQAADTPQQPGDQGKKKKSSLLGNMIKQGVGGLIP